MAMTLEILSCFCFLILVTLVRAAESPVYALDTDYSGTTFFDEWDFFTGHDPTNGFVNYLDYSDADALGLIDASSTNAYIGVDYTSVLSPSGTGRDSVRITTKKGWTHGLFIADLASMPGSICGLWPAFWMFNPPNWPNNGEIDIIEGVNQAEMNTMTLHTGANCTMPNPGPQLGDLQNSQCDGTLDGFAGCGVTTGNSDLGARSYGDKFNAGGGGVYATEWTSDHIKIWFFPRGSVPSDIEDGVPDPSAWSTPLSFFQDSSNCDIDGHFAGHHLVFDITFCGDWAGDSYVFGDDGGICSSHNTVSCQQYVGENPTAFVNANWLINSVKVYQLEDVTTPTAAASSTLATVASASGLSALPSTSSLYMPPTVTNSPVLSEVATAWSQQSSASVSQVASYPSLTNSTHFSNSSTNATFTSATNISSSFSYPRQTSSSVTLPVTSTAPPSSTSSHVPLIVNGLSGLPLKESVEDFLDSLTPRYEP